ncbi:GAD-like domain-containing protein [uncultured Psychrobacter sp.]|uniref:GAD-like domain-containing protein n=1 Tax=uncultured Psychrobacter sp. TaxID=259303 RepID=UPI002635D3E3|nr:GAD-like domain-containing protein [uncultured Psychrobacter sp.]
MSDFIIDEKFDFFMEDFGQPDWQYPVEQATLEYYRGKLPDKLLFYWEKMGFCRFKQGLFWIVNPADYEDELVLWLDEDILKQDNYYVIARSGFGKLYVWGEKSGFAFEITPTYGWVYQEQGDAKDIAAGLEDRAIQLFFTIQQVQYVDMEDNNDKPLFKRCVKKFGALEYDEMFGFVPALAISDNASIKNVDKMNIFVHLNILADLIEIQHINFKKLGQMAFGVDDTSNLPDLDDLV